MQGKVRFNRVPEKVPAEVAQKVPLKLAFLLVVFMHVHTPYHGCH